MTVQFLSLPVDGDIIRPGSSGPQLTKEQLGEIVQTLLDDEHIVSFGWSQYTPYNNDGETCYFSTGGLWVETVLDCAPGPDPDPEASASEAHDDEDDEDEGYERDDRSERLAMYHHPTLDDQYWDRQLGKFVDREVKLPETAKRARVLSDVIEDGTADAVLLGLFGDHARVTVTKERITVDSYDEHD